MSSRSIIESLDAIIKKHKPDTIMTIGDRCLFLRLVPPTSLGLGIDPWPIVKINELPPNLKVFPVTSDYFFHSPYMVHDLSVDFVLITGYRKFEQLLRDIVFSEKLCKPTARIVIHGTVPLSKEEASRDDVPNTERRVGDVFKCIEALKKYRPDLRITTLTDVGAGLTIIDHLDESNHTVQNSMVKVVADFINQPWDQRDTSTDTTFEEYMKSHD